MVSVTKKRDEQQQTSDGTASDAHVRTVTDGKSSGPT